MIVEELIDISEVLTGTRITTDPRNCKKVDEIVESLSEPVPSGLKDLYKVHGISADGLQSEYRFAPLSALSTSGDLVWGEMVTEEIECAILAADRFEEDPPVKERPAGESEWFSGGRSVAGAIINICAWGKPADMQIQDNSYRSRTLRLS